MLYLLGFKNENISTTTGSSILVPRFVFDFKGKVQLRWVRQAVFSVVFFNCFMFRID